MRTYLHDVPVEVIGCSESGGLVMCKVKGEGVILRSKDLHSVVGGNKKQREAQHAKFRRRYNELTDTLTQLLSEWKGQVADANESQSDHA